MSWIDRTRDHIHFISPSGKAFDAKWCDDDVTIQKRVSRHAHPDMDGEIAQDLGLNSVEWPLTFYFDDYDRNKIYDGDHDLKLRDFRNALSERGVWIVNHPIEGQLILQPVKATFKIGAVENANITTVESDWFEPAEAEPTDDQIYGTNEAIKNASNSSLNAGSRINPKNASELQKALATAKKSYEAAKKAIRVVNDKVYGIMSTINDLTTKAYMEAASLSGAVVQLLQAPGLFLGNCSARVQQFVELGNKIMKDVPDAAAFSANQISAAMTGELWLNAISAGMGTAILEHPPETRGEALGVLQQYKNYSLNARETLDALVKASNRNMIADQYFQDPESIEAMLQLNAAIAKYLISAAFDLKTEKRFVLDRDRATMEIVITETGATAGNVDELYKQFCLWNNLHGRELLLINRDREIVIYG